MARLVIHTSRRTGVSAGPVALLLLLAIALPYLFIAAAVIVLYEILRWFVTR